MLTSSQKLPLDNYNQSSQLAHYQYHSGPQYSTFPLQVDNSYMMHNQVPPSMNTQGAYSQSDIDDRFRQVTFNQQQQMVNMAPPQQNSTLVGVPYSSTQYMQPSSDQAGLQSRFVANQFPFLQTGTRKGGGGRKRKPIDNLDEKKILFLERNRQAALKCRLRKKKNQETMMLKFQLLQQQNRQLEITRDSLNQQIQELTSLLNHHQYCPVYQNNIQGLANAPPQNELSQK
ncbi:hypothetical protein K502DRAFT_364895 [Neoconidiobolus thromboides FSU 785]|nr:hypothetical protein K502DRAFT_364895 [Neoconidiobolus thromboides FSU 785]